MNRFGMAFALLALGAFAIVAPASDVSGQQLNRVNVTQKGSCLVWPHVEIAWDLVTGDVYTDTIISLTNDLYTNGVRVKLFLVNGDDQIPFWIPLGGGAPLEPGANQFQDAVVDLTHDEPLYWSALTGAKTGSMSGAHHPSSIMTSMTALDPDGRDHPDFMNPNVVRVRGFLVAFAIGPNGEPIRHNHLVGSATYVDYFNNAAFEYKAWTYRALFTSVPGGEPGRLNMNGLDYDANPEFLLMEFFAQGSDAYGPDLTVPPSPSVANGFVTLLPMMQNFTTDRPEQALTTDIKLDVWDENEVPHTNLHRCINCWDSALFDEFATMNNFFTRPYLTTDRGKARFNGRANINCNRAADPYASPPDPGHVSVDAPIIGLSAQIITWLPDRVALTGKSLSGMGERTDGFIVYEPVGNPPEITQPDTPKARTLRMLD